MPNYKFSESTLNVGHLDPTEKHPFFKDMFPIKETKCQPAFDMKM